MYANPDKFTLDDLKEIELGHGYDFDHFEAMPGDTDIRDIIRVLDISLPATSISER